MTGPEHYREAERRLLMAWEEDSPQERSTQLVAEAQVHATLALAAATAHHVVATSVDDRGGGGKARGAGVPPAAAAGVWCPPLPCRSRRLAVAGPQPSRSRRGRKPPLKPQPQTTATGTPDTTTTTRRPAARHGATPRPDRGRAFNASAQGQSMNDPSRRRACRDIKWRH